IKALATRSLRRFATNGESIRPKAKSDFLASLVPFRTTGDSGVVYLRCHPPELQEQIAEKQSGRAQLRQESEKGDLRHRRPATTGVSKAGGSILGDNRLIDNDPLPVVFKQAERRDESLRQ